MHGRKFNRSNRTLGSVWQVVAIVTPFVIFRYFEYFDESDPWKTRIDDIVGNNNPMDTSTYNSPHQSTEQTNPSLPKARLPVRAGTWPDRNMNICSTMIRTLALAAVSCASLMMSAVALGQTNVGTELDLLRRDDIRSQLGLTQTQTQKIDEVTKAGSISQEFIKSYLERMKGKTPEEQTAIRTEMNQAVLKAKEAAGLEGLKLLDSRQLKVLRSRYVAQAGIRALTDSRVAADFSLTDEQKSKLAALNTARSEAATQLGFKATEEQTAAFEAEWETKFLEVLNADQKGLWAALKSEDGAAQAPLTALAGTTSPQSSSAESATDDATPPPGAQITSSFGSAADGAESSQRVEKFSFNFRYAPWEQVLQDFAVSTGYTLDMAQIPNGTFSHIDSKEYNVDQTLDIMNGYLQRKGFTLVRKDGFLVCVNVDKGIPNILVPDVSLEQLTAKDAEGNYSVGENELVRIQILLKGVDVGVMATEVESLTGPLARMTALTQSGMLIISDTGANLRKINTFLQAAMANVEKNLIFKSYPLVNIDAEEAEFMLLAQFGMRQGASAVPNVSSGGSDGRRGQPPAPPTQTSSLKVMSDTRTNSLFVTGSKDDQALVEEIIKAIDIDELPDGTKLTRTGASGPYLRVYKVTGRADQAALSINAMMPGVVVNEDNSAGTVHIFGTTKQHQQVAEWVEAFAAGSGAAGSVAVIPLVKMDPLSAAATLRNLFVSEGTAAPTIETDLYGNRVIVKGTATQVDQIKQVLKDLGEDGTGVRTRGEGGTMRRYSLRGRDPAEFMPYLEREWTNNESTRIRIVVPTKNGPIRDLRTPSKAVPGATEERRAEPAESPAATQSPRRSGLRKQTGYVMVRRQDEGPENTPSVDDSSQGTADDKQPGPFDGIQIVVDGDDLLLLYKDEEALDRLEETMDFLQQSIPYRTRWTVFYLQASDATEAAALLEQLIPSSSVTNTAESTGFSFGSVFRPITDSVSSMTGLSGIGQNPQTLRIIPDPRSNSLLVTGPQSLVDEAEKLLEVLDSNDIPESLRDMQPRQLTVEYADIDEVATIVKEVFKPYMESAAGQQQQNNPFAALMGGGGGNKKESTGVQMTIGVDRQTSSLVVSSSEALFVKVESLVKERDEAAKAARQTVRYVQLMHSDATMVQNSLSAMFPRVTSSSTKTTSSSTSDNPSRSDNSNSSNNNNSQTPANPFGGRGGTRGFSPFGGGGGFSPFGGGTGGSPFGGGGTGGSPFGGDRSSRGGRGGRGGSGR